MASTTANRGFFFSTFAGSAASAVFRRETATYRDIVAMICFSSWRRSFG